MRTQVSLSSHSFQIRSDVLCAFANISYFLILLLLLSPLQANAMSSSQQASPASPQVSQDSANTGIQETPAILPQITALQLFQLLPPSIFDNTPSPLSEEEKLQLTEQGRCKKWQLVFSGKNQLNIFSLPDGTPQIVMYVFRPHAAPVTGEAMVAIGTVNTEMCAMELWYYTPPNRLVPLPLPDDPTLEDFFDEKNPLPAGTTASFMICLDGHYLEAYPMLWSTDGPIERSSDKTVHYHWTGTGFTKK